MIEKRLKDPEGYVVRVSWEGQDTTAMPSSMRTVFADGSEREVPEKYWGEVLSESIEVPIGTPGVGRPSESV